MPVPVRFIDPRPNISCHELLEPGLVDAFLLKSVDRVVVDSEL